MGLNSVKNRKSGSFPGSSFKRTVLKLKDFALCLSYSQSFALSSEFSSGKIKKKKEEEATSPLTGGLSFTKGAVKILIASILSVVGFHGLTSVVRTGWKNSSADRDVVTVGTRTQITLSAVRLPRTSINEGTKSPSSSALSSSSPSLRPTLQKSRSLTEPSGPLLLSCPSQSLSPSLHSRRCWTLFCRCWRAWISRCQS